MASHEKIVLTVLDYVGKNNNKVTKSKILISIK